jgi:hypothetical protein
VDQIKGDRARTASHQRWQMMACLAQIPSRERRLHCSGVDTRSRQVVLGLGREKLARGEEIDEGGAWRLCIEEAWDRKWGRGSDHGAIRRGGGGSGFAD